MATGIKVLMVDDEAQFRATTSKILSRRGYETTVAESGEQAIEILKKSPQDVVILDIRMPGMDGHEALARIKEINPDAQVIMLTGHGGGESAKESLKHGAFDYLNKPCDIELLSMKIRDAYDAKRQGVREEKKAGDIMIPIADYTTIDPESTVRQAIERLRKSFETAAATSRIKGFPQAFNGVLDKRGELVGILSIVDLIQALRPAYLSAPKPSMADSMQYSAMFWSGLFTTQAKALGQKRIGDVMSEAPLKIDENANLMEIANLIYAEKQRRVAVTRKGKVVGVVREQEIFFEMSRIILAA